MKTKKFTTEDTEKKNFRHEKTKHYAGTERGESGFLVTLYS